MTYGYARCSTNDAKQDIDRQVRELKKQGAQQVFLEYEHGDSRVKRQLAALLDEARPGDTVLTLEVSRLTRSTKQLCELLEDIRKKRLRLVIVGSIAVDCRQGDMDAMTKAFLQIAGVFSELELSMTRERIKSGLQNARANGKTLGRPRTTKEDIPAIFLKHYAAYRASLLNVAELARVCNLSRPTIYKYIDILEAVP